MRKGSAAIIALFFILALIVGAAIAYETNRPPNLPSVKDKVMRWITDMQEKYMN